MNEDNKKLNLMVVLLIIISFSISSIFLSTKRNNIIASETHPDFSVDLYKEKESTYYYYNNNFSGLNYNSSIINNYTIDILENTQSIDKKVSCLTNYSNIDSHFIDLGTLIFYASEINISFYRTDLNYSIYRENSTTYTFEYNNTDYYFDTNNDSFLVILTTSFLQINMTIISINDTYNYLFSFNAFYNNLLQIDINLITNFIYFQSSVNINYSNLKMITANTFYNLISANIVYYTNVDNTSYVSGRYRLSLYNLTLLNLNFEDIKIFSQPDGLTSYQFLSYYQKRIFILNAECYSYMVNSYDFSSLENYVYYISIYYEYYPNLFEL